MAKKTTKYEIKVCEFNTAFPYFLGITATEFNDFLEHYKKLENYEEDAEYMDYEVSIKYNEVDTESGFRQEYCIGDNGTTIFLTKTTCKEGYRFKTKRELREERTKL